MLKRLEKIIVFCLFMGTITGYAGQESTRSSAGIIVFTSYRTGNWEVWMMSGDGKHPEQLTFTPEDERAPALSPDGKRVVYSNNKGEIWLLTIGDKRSFRLPVPDGNYDQPAWHPGTDKITVVAIVNTPKENSIFYEVDLGKNKYQMKQLFPLKRLKMQPAWSPDGTTLAFSRFHRSKIQEPIEEIWFYNTKSEQVRKVTNTEMENFQVCWEPRGRMIGFTANLAGNYDIWILGCKSALLKRLTTSPAYDVDPHFSPDGSKIVFVSSRTGNKQLWIISSDGTDRKQLTYGKYENKDPYWGK